MNKMQQISFTFLVFFGAFAAFTQGFRNFNPRINNRFIANEKLQELYLKVNKDLVKANKEMDDNSEAFILRYKKWEKDSNAEHEEIIKAAQKKGKSAQDINECLFRKNEFERLKMNSKWKEIEGCRNDATSRQSKSLDELKKGYWETLTEFSVFENNHEGKLLTCNKDSDCVKKEKFSYDEKLNRAMQQGEQLLKIADETTKKHKALLNICFEGFFEKLPQYEEHSISSLKKCVQEVKVQPKKSK